MGANKNICNKNIFVTELINKLNKDKLKGSAILISDKITIPANK
jgi:hypothetical protein